MKYITFIVIGFLFCVQFSRAESYQIYSFEKSVYIKKGNDNWQQAKKKSQINSNDSIKLGINSSVKILNISSGQIFEWRQQGKFEVRDIVSSCLSKKSSWLQRLFSTLMENIKDDPKKLWVSQGSTKRGNPDDDFAHAIAYELIRCCYTDVSTSPNLILKTCNAGKKEYYFEITNNTLDTLYVNVLAVNIKQESFSLVFDVRDKNNWMVFPLKPHTSLSFPEFLISEKSKYKYVVFGTSKPFGIVNLEKYLNKDVSDNIFTTDENIIIIGKEQK